MINIPIYMYPLITPEADEIIAKEAYGNPFEGSNFENEYYGPSARFFFRYIFERHNLSRNDEIAIITTSDATYVSTCVTIPCFNYAKVSRVVTDATKIVIIIHEYGYVLDDIETIISSWKAKGLVVIEDCAHVAGLKIGRKTVGAFGDYALFSLTKTIPGTYGGLLRTNEQIKNIIFTDDEYMQTRTGQRSAEKYLPKQAWFNDRRNENADVIKKFLKIFTSRQRSGVHILLE